jgi:hypothetical protein
MTSYNNDVLVDMGDYDGSSSNSNEELFQRTQKVHQMVFATIVANTNTLDLFNSKELYLNAGQLVDHKVGVEGMFSTVRVTPSLFKTLTNFNLLEFEDLFVLAVPPSKPMQKPLMKFTLCLGDKLNSPQTNVCSNSSYI